MSEHSEYIQIREMVNELMSGGPFGDGIGPNKTAYRVNAKFGTTYEGYEIWRIWRQGKKWAKPQDDIYPG